MTETNRRRLGITYNGIISETDNNWVKIAYPQIPKSGAKVPFFGMLYGAEKGLNASFETGDYELFANHKFKEWDQVTVNIYTRDERKKEVIETETKVAFPIGLVEVGDKWLSGIFTMKEAEGGDVDFTYDLPIAHPFKPYDELIIEIEKRVEK